MMASRRAGIATNIYSSSYPQQPPRHLVPRLGIDQVGPRFEQLERSVLDDQDGTESSSCSIMPWAAFVSLCGCLPPEYEGFQKSFPSGPYGGFMDREQDAYEPAYAFEYGDRNEFSPQDESFLKEYGIDELQQPKNLGYAQPMPYSALRGQNAFLQGKARTSPRKPYACVDQEEPLLLGNNEGSGDAEECPGTHEPNVWESLQKIYYGPLVTNYGTVSVILQHNMRVDLSVDGAVRVVNFSKRCTAAISSHGDRSCVCHPCGRALQEGINVDMATGRRLAKISSRGITFTALNHGLVYLVDPSGTKSTRERFRNLNFDLPMGVFYSKLQRGMEVFHDCYELLSRARQRSAQNGDEIWVVGHARIKQTPWGDVQVSCDSGRRVIWSSPTAGSISVTTPLVKMSVSCDPSRYILVRAGQKRIVGSSDGFTVRNGSQRAGFDARGRLTLP